MIKKIEPQLVSEWIYKVIEGPTGFKVWEERESVIFFKSREACIAKFVIDALANPSCEGSQELLGLINDHREQYCQYDSCLRHCEGSDDCDGSCEESPEGMEVIEWLNNLKAINWDVLQAKTNSVLYLKFLNHKYKQKK